MSFTEYTFEESRLLGGVWRWHLKEKLDLNRL